METEIYGDRRALMYAVTFGCTFAKATMSGRPWISPVESTRFGLGFGRAGWCGSVALTRTLTMAVRV